MLKTIYEWECDVHRYEWVEWMDEFYGASYEPFGDPDPFAKTWRVKKLVRCKNATDAERPMSDSPHSRTFLRILSGRAVDALRDLLEPACEILPLESDLGEYWAIHVMAQADCLDAQQSKVRRSTNGGIMQVCDWIFLPDKASAASVFRLPEAPAYFLCSDEFVRRVKQQGLTGFKFKKLWSSAPSARNRGEV